MLADRSLDGVRQWSGRDQQQRRAQEEGELRADRHRVVEAVGGEILPGCDQAVDAERAGDQQEGRRQEEGARLPRAYSGDAEHGRHQECGDAGGRDDQEVLARDGDHRIPG
jgi:hypothetical protein